MVVVYLRKILCNVLEKNPGYDSLNDVHKCLNGEDVNLPEEIYSSLSVFKYCPVTSVDVVRSFSACKLFLTDKRSPEHMEKLIVV